MGSVTTAFRAHLVDMMVAKAAGGDALALVDRGAALLIGMRSEESDALLKAANPTTGATEAKRRVEAAEDEMLALRYQKARCVHGITASRRGAALALPAGLVSEEEAEALAEAELAAENKGTPHKPTLPPARDDHQRMLRRLAVEHNERRRLAAAREATQADARRRKASAAEVRKLAEASRGQLDGLLFAAAALRTQLARPMSLPLSPAAAALERQLPDPLFCLWRATAALLDAWRRGGGGGALPSVSLREVPPNCTLFAPGPVEVVLVAPAGASLAFSYHAAPGVIGVSVIGVGAPRLDSLRALFADDDARGFPDERTLLRVASSSARPRDAAGCESMPGVEAMAPALPFRWAQWMGGVGPPLGDGREVKSTHAVLQALCGWLQRAD